MKRTERGTESTERTERDTERYREDRERERYKEDKERDTERTEREIEIRYFEPSSQAFQFLLKCSITFDLCYSCLLFKPAIVVYSDFNTLVMTNS